MSQYKGVVKWFNNAKGYGFLGREDGQADVFAHYSGIKQEGFKSLKQGEEVRFNIVRGEKGLQAEEIEPVEETNGEG